MTGGSVLFGIVMIVCVTAVEQVHDLLPLVWHMLHIIPLVAKGHELIQQLLQKGIGSS